MGVVMGWIGSWKMDAVSLTLLNSPSTVFPDVDSSCWENEDTISFTLLNSVVTTFSLLPHPLPVVVKAGELPLRFLEFLKAEALMEGSG